MGFMFFRKASPQTEGRCDADPRIKTSPVGPVGSHSQKQNAKKRDRYFLYKYKCMGLERYRERGRHAGAGASSAAPGSSDDEEAASLLTMASMANVCRVVIAISSGKSSTTASFAFSLRARSARNDRDMV